MASEHRCCLDAILEGMTLAERRQWHSRAARAGERRERGRALVEWMLKFEWEWFVTLTFVQAASKPNRLGFCQRRVGKWLHVLNARIHGRAYRRQRTALYGVTVWERHKSGEWHAHMLVANTGDYRRLSAMDDWDALAGYARIYPPAIKSVAYVVKYVVKSGAWDVFGNWKRDRQQRFE